MDLIISAFNTLLYQPLFNALVLLYQYLPGQDLGIAVIVLTILIRLAIYPLTLQGIRSQKVLQELQPKIKEIQEKHKGNKEKQAKETMGLYQKEKINPLSGCLPLLVQLPILLALYQVLIKGLRPEALSSLYSFVPFLDRIDPTFLGLINLGEPFVILAFLTGAVQFIQTKMITPKTKSSKKGGSNFTQMMQKQMLYFFPVFTVLILLRLPSALALYWLISSLFTILQQKIMLKPTPANQNVNQNVQPK